MAKTKTAKKPAAKKAAKKPAKKAEVKKLRPLCDRPCFTTCANPLWTVEVSRGVVVDMSPIVPFLLALCRQVIDTFGKK